MTWVRIPEESASDHDVRAVGDVALGLHVRALAYSNQHLLDGAIPACARPILGAKKAVVERLFAFGWWRDKGNGAAELVKWLDLQPSKQSVELERHMAHVRSALRSAPELMRLLKKRDGEHCRYCARSVNWADRRGPSGGTYDHVRPVSKGGGNELENLVVACRACNLLKGNRTLEESCLVLLPAPNQIPTGSHPVPIQKPTSLPVPSRPVPDLLQPERTTAKPVRSDAREAPPLSSSELVPCPRDLTLTEDQIATLETALVPRTAIGPLTLRFVAKAVADPDDARTLPTWRKCLAMAVSSGWNNPKIRGDIATKPPGELEHDARRREASMPWTPPSNGGRPERDTWEHPDGVVRDYPPGEHASPEATPAPPARRPAGPIQARAPGEPVNLATALGALVRRS